MSGAIGGQVGFIDPCLDLNLDSLTLSVTISRKKTIASAALF
jgi:hypothetical protein